MSDRLRAALDEIDQDTLGAAEKGGDFTDGVEWAVFRMRFAIDAAQRDEGGIDVERLAVAMNTAQLTCDEIRFGRDLRVPAARILAALGQ